MQLKALYPFNWTGHELAAGDTFEAESPEDDEQLAYWAKFGAYGPVDAPVPPQPGAPGEPPRGPTEPPATEAPVSIDMPSHVGRRQRAPSETAEQ